MDELANVFARGDMNQVMINEERPPPRDCPRCNSDNTKFCYYNNYTVSQPRYFCKNCRRYWTHGGALRNIPIGGSCRKPKRTSKPDQQQQVVSVDNNTQQDTNNHHQNQQPFLNVQETNEFLGNFHHETNYNNNNHHAGGIVTNVGPIQTSRPVLDRLDFSDVAYQQDYYDVGSNDLIGNPLINQAIAGSNVANSDYNQWNQGFDSNAMSMNHGASTSGDGGTSSNGHMNIVRNTFVFRPTYHFEKHGP